jgi:hypothetical protein
VQRLFNWLRLPNQGSWTPLIFAPGVDLMDSTFLAQPGLISRVQFSI